MPPLSLAAALAGPSLPVAPQVERRLLALGTPSRLLTLAGCNAVRGSVTARPTAAPAQLPADPSASFLPEIAAAPLSALAATSRLALPAPGALAGIIAVHSAAPSALPSPAAMRLPDYNAPRRPMRRPPSTPSRVRPRARVMPRNYPSRPHRIPAPSPLAFVNTSERLLPVASFHTLPPSADAPAPVPPPVQPQVQEPAVIPPLHTPPLHTRILTPMPQRPQSIASRVHLEPLLGAQVAHPEPHVPRIRLAPDQPNRRGQSLPGFARKGLFARLGSVQMHIPGRAFWSHAPSDLKMIGIGLPLVVALVIYSVMPSGKPVPAAPDSASFSTPEAADFRPAAHRERGAAQSASPAASPKETHPSRLNWLQLAVRSRAAVDYLDDFRSGLAAWTGQGDWARTWKYNQAQFVEPGQLALYSPTLPLADYSLEFLGQIGRRSLNWAFRAKDLKNYYAMRLVVTKSGTLTQGTISHSVVIDGRKVSEKTLPLPMPIREDALLRVRTEVNGNTFTTWIQEQVVDNFTDTRLERGGVGFFSPGGERALLRWVEVKHQYDLLGRLCAMIAPYRVQAEGRIAE